MNSLFPRVRLGSFLRHRKEFFTLNDTAQYKRIRVKLHNKGVVLRDIVHGAELNTKKQQEAKAGELLVAEIDAKVGGFGIVPPELDAAIVSGHYFLYEIDESKCLQGWLDSFIRAAGLEEQVKARGSTNYAAIRSEHILDFEIPLPRLPEQRRIVARIEELAAKIEEARRLRARTLEQIDRLVIGMAHRSDLDEATKRRNGWIEIQLGDILRQVRDPHSVDPAATYSNLGIYSFGRGLFRKVPISGNSTSAQVLYRVGCGQFIYSRLFAFEGAYGVVTDQFDGYFVSNEYPTFVCARDRVRPEFLYAYFMSPSVWRNVAAGSKGLGHRRQRVQPDQILAYRLMLPPLPWQDRIRAVMTQTEPVKRLQTESAQQLEAVLSSVLDRTFRGELT
jgi:type I restriction enzyme S subunit